MKNHADTNTSHDDDAMMERLADFVTPMVIRVIRGVAITLITSLLIYLGPLYQPRFMLFGVIIGAMSLMNVTKYFAGLALLLLLVIAMAEPYLARLS